jgi:hypothetical protein
MTTNRPFWVIKLSWATHREAETHPTSATTSGFHRWIVFPPSTRHGSSNTPWSQLHGPGRGSRPGGGHRHMRRQRLLRPPDGVGVYHVHARESDGVRYIQAPISPSELPVQPRGERAGSECRVWNGYHASGVWPSGSCESISWRYMDLRLLILSLCVQDPGYDLSSCAGGKGAY